MGLDTAIYIVAILLIVYFMFPKVAADILNKVGLDAYAPKEGVYGGPNADPINEAAAQGVVMGEYGTQKFGCARDDQQLVDPLMNTLHGYGACE